MDDEAADELRVLQARVYGPAADLHDSPEALRRIGELEALRRGASTVVLDPVAAPDAAPVGPSAPRVRGIDDHASVTPSPPTADGGVVADADDEPVAPATSKASRRRAGRRGRLPLTMRILWAASVAATAAIAVGATYALVAIQPVPTSNGAAQIATLRPTQSLAVPAGFMGAGPSSLVYEFSGLALFETSYGAQAGNGDCMSVMVADQIPEKADANGSWSLTGMAYSGCAVGSFPATIAFRVDSSAPAALRDRYSAKALQFVKQGDVIGVFLDD
jgi:hypothetical protein